MNDILPDKPKLETKSALSIVLLDKDAHPAEVHKAIAMHNQTITASNSFHNLFCDRHRGGLDANDLYEQDLLRAMLLFSCSGLDAVAKQLVRDGLEKVISRDEGAQREFAKFIERRLKRGSNEESLPNQSGQVSVDYALLSIALASPEPRLVLINSLTQTLISDSLQSRDQLLKVASHFALTREDVLTADNITKDAFHARNQLAHEMDIDFVAQERRPRAYASMIQWSENILNVAHNFILKVSNKIST